MYALGYSYSFFGKMHNFALFMEIFVIFFKGHLEERSQSAGVKTGFHPSLPERLIPSGSHIPYFQKHR